MNMIHPDALLWLHRAGILDPDPEGVDRGEGGRASFQADLHGQEWNPQTLKQISTHVLALGKASGQAMAAMRVLAEIEVSLKRLRDRIGIARNAPPDVLTRVTALMSMDSGDGATWVSPGKWVPDIIDRAAGFDPLHANHSGDRVVSASELISYRLDHIILLDNAPFSFDGVPVHRVQTPGNWLGSGPGVFDAIFEAAFILHGIKG
jgi:hypothetical protein